MHLTEQTRSTLCHNVRFGQSCVCVCVFGNPQRRKISSCAMSVRCVFIAPGMLWPNFMHLTDQTRSTLRHNGRFGQSCVCVFLVTLKGARSNVVPCRFGVCVYCGRHLVAKLYALNRANAIHSAPQWSVRSKLCVCMLLVTLNVRDLRQGYCIADNIADTITPILSHYGPFR